MHWPGVSESPSFMRTCDMCYEYAVQINVTVALVEHKNNKERVRTLGQTWAGFPRVPGIAEQHRLVQASSAPTAFITGNCVWNQG